MPCGAIVRTPYLWGSKHPYLQLLPPKLLSRLVSEMKTEAYFSNQQSQEK